MNSIRAPLNVHPERRLPERRNYAQRCDFAAPSKRKPLRVDPSTAHGAGAPRLLRMTFQASECVQTLFSFRKSTVSGQGEGSGRLCFLILLATCFLFAACKSGPPLNLPPGASVLQLTASDDVPTLDPALGYDTASWSFEQAIFDTWSATVTPTWNSSPTSRLAGRFPQTQPT